MLGRTIHGKKGGGSSGAGGSSGEDGGDARLLHEIEALSRALSFDPKSRSRSLAPSSSSRSISADPDPKHNPLKEKKKKNSSSSIWNWKPFKALSHIGWSRLDCVFSLHVHSIDGLPPSLDGAPLAVHWRRSTDPQFSTAGTRPSITVRGAAVFEETLAHLCVVYATTRAGSGGTAKYEARQFVIHASVEGSMVPDLGRHIVDLTRILPLSLDEVSEEKSAGGRWSTGFKLSGKARGAVLNVSFGYSLVGDGLSGRKSKRAPAMPDARLERQGSIDLSGRLPPANSRNPPPFPSVENIKVLHEVPLSSMPMASSAVSDVREEIEEVLDKGGKGKNLGAESPELEKACGLLETLEDEKEKNDRDELQEFIVQKNDRDELQEFIGEKNDREELQEFIGENNDRDELPEFMVIEKGLEIAPAGESAVNKAEECDLERVDEGHEGKKGELGGGATTDELGSDPEILSIVGDGVELGELEFSTPEKADHEEFKSRCEFGATRSKSMSLDDLTESIANEFLASLGIEQDPSGPSSDCDGESPLRGANAASWDEFSEDLDLSAMVLEAEAELEKATLAADSKLKAQMLEDAETEALMREWGMNERAFRQSPPGSPIDLPPEAAPEELPSLGDGLGAFLQTRDGGFLRTMSPSLFENSKNRVVLVMQVSNPVVVPAEMGSGVTEILKDLAAVGVEKLSMQATKLMPLEDITGKTMQQVAWEASPAMEAESFSEYLQQLNGGSRIDIVDIGNVSSGREKGRSFNPSSDVDSEYVSLEDLAPLAMDKIEALSMEGLRIQSGMSGEEAPSNVAASGLSLGLEGAAGMQLVDVGDNRNRGDAEDGLMGLSITLDEWMKLDSGIVRGEGGGDDHVSDRTSKILAAYHAKAAEFFVEGKGGRRGGGRRWGLLGNSFTVALMVQLRDPLRNYEPVGTPMLALVQVERAFVPPKPRIYSSVSANGSNRELEVEEEEEEEELERTTTKSPEIARSEEDEEEAVPGFKIAEVRVAGLNSAAEPGKKSSNWGSPMQQKSGSRWLLASGMGKSSKNQLPFAKPSKATAAVAKPSSSSAAAARQGDTLWSISSRFHGSGSKWKEPPSALMKAHTRNPNVIFPRR